MNVVSVGICCSGCGACVFVCPHQCIEMKPDTEGFYQPTIDQKKCIECGLCVNKCPVINKIELNKETLGYACVAKDGEIRENSSSGGVFSVLAEKILLDGGIVYGASYIDDYKAVRHIRVTNSDDLKKLRGSKYVQSSIISVIPMIKRDLQEKKKVLFSGTPCQIAGLICCVGMHDNLITLDIICHGVPSEIVWKKYVEEISPETPQYVSMRDKTSGWQSFSMKIVFRRKTYKKDLKSDLYLKGFLQNIYLRKSCYQCAFKTKERCSDLTLADFWGCQLIEFGDCSKGVSLVGVHSEKGINLFESPLGKIQAVPVAWREMIKANSAALHSVEMPECRKNFFKDFEDTHSFRKSLKKCLKNEPLIDRVKYRIKKSFKIINDRRKYNEPFH